MKKVLVFAAVGEVVTGLALLAVPVLVGRLLLGAELAGVSIPVARVAGLALLALGVGCLADSVWLGMWLYTVFVTLYLAYLGLFTAWAGFLLWPAVAMHAALTLLLAITQFARTRLPTLDQAKPGAAT